MATELMSYGAAGVGQGTDDNRKMRNQQVEMRSQDNAMLMADKRLKQEAFDKAQSATDPVVRQNWLDRENTYKTTTTDEYGHTNSVANVGVAPSVHQKIANQLYMKDKTNEFHNNTEWVQNGVDAKGEPVYYPKEMQGVNYNAQLANAQDIANKITDLKSKDPNADVSQLENDLAVANKTAEEHYGKEKAFKDNPIATTAATQHAFEENVKLFKPQAERIYKGYDSEKGRLDALLADKKITQGDYMNRLKQAENYTNAAYANLQKTLSSKGIVFDPQSGSFASNNLNEAISKNAGAAGLKEGDYFVGRTVNGVSDYKNPNTMGEFKPIANPNGTWNKIGNWFKGNVINPVTGFTNQVINSASKTINNAIPIQTQKVASPNQNILQQAQPIPNVQPGYGILQNAQSIPNAQPGYNGIFNIPQYPAINQMLQGRP